VNVVDAGLRGLFLLELEVFDDIRGRFFESFNASRYRGVNFPTDFVQDNVSVSSYGVIRGLHFQTGEFAQAKPVQVLRMGTSKA
jgi:dTDP-4-dehydrorhamnose 3,5-epimerase